MANHVRQQIREAIATALTGLATTGNRVFQSRITPLQDDELPALLVSTNSEKVDALSVSFNSILERELAVLVTVVAKATDNLDDALDMSIKEVEAALNATVEANTLNGLVKEIVLTDIDIEMNADAETPTGQALLTLKASYYTQANTPDVSI
ncbi:MAG: hypothetical protein Q8S71_03760 [Hydrogenophaga sp.]|nr:hypothetical protein [Hydrogenophaga sp.]